MTDVIHLNVDTALVYEDEVMDVAGPKLTQSRNDPWEKCEPELKLWNATKPQLPKTLPKVSLEEIHALYSKDNKEKTIGEDDLRPDEERWICEYAAKKFKSEAVFVTDWPTDSKS